MPRLRLVQLSKVLLGRWDGGRPEAPGEQYVQLLNRNAYAVDLSAARLSAPATAGALNFTTFNYTFPPGEAGEDSLPASRARVHGMELLMTIMHDDDAPRALGLREHARSVMLWVCRTAEDLVHAHSLWHCVLPSALPAYRAAALSMHIAVWGAVLRVLQAQWCLAAAASTSRPACLHGAHAARPPRAARYARPNMHALGCRFDVRGLAADPCHHASMLGVTLLITAPTCNERMQSQASRVAFDSR